MKPKFKVGERVTFRRIGDPFSGESDRLYYDKVATVWTYGWDDRQGEHFYILTVDGESEGGARELEHALKKYRKPAAKALGVLRPPPAKMSPLDEQARAIAHYALTTPLNPIAAGGILAQTFGLPREVGWAIYNAGYGYIPRNGIEPRDSSGYVRKIKNILSKL